MQDFFRCFRSEAGARLLVASFAALFFELLFIRWLPASLHVLAFFGNVVLIASVLGLGVGVASANRDVARVSLAAAAWLTIVIAFILTVSYLDPGVDYNNRNLALNEGVGKRAGLAMNLYVALAMVFFLTAQTFVPLGRLVGVYLSKLPPLPGYSINILGSLLGIVSFATCSALSLPPSVWLAIGLGVTFLVFPPALPPRGSTTASRWLVLTLVLAVAGGVQYFERRQADATGWQTIWSPYYQVRVTFGEGGFRVNVNNQFLLTGADFGQSAPRTAGVAFWRKYYDLPYAVFHPQSVLVLGAGAGNDVAAALRHGAAHVDAVEIDPVIIWLGRRFHPEHPYADARVRVINDDARSFLRRTDRRYDLVVFGTLDSHTLFSTLSSLKIENYVYTVDCFRDVRRVLNPQGGMYLAFSPWIPWLRWRLYATVASAFQQVPRMFDYGQGGNMVLFAGAMPADLTMLSDSPLIGHDLSECRQAIDRSTALGDIPTDDWPHLFLRERGIPPEYLGVLGILVMLAVFFVAFHTGIRDRPSMHFFTLGAGFMLLETLSITIMGLLFGSTWQTNNLVISAMLVTIFVANMVLYGRTDRLQVQWFYAALFVVLTFLYFFQPQQLLTRSVLVKCGLAILIVGLPVVASAVIFGTSFARTRDVKSALAWNMLGSVMGGLLEYASMIFGLHPLYLMALGIYVISLLTLERQTAPHLAIGK